MSKTAEKASRRPTAGQLLLLPPQWLAAYDDFVTKNAGQVSQIESALRSLTYIIPGRFRDAEIASESIHSGVQLLSLYHDSLLSRAITKLPIPTPAPTAHARYTKFWMGKSKIYRRIATLLQMVIYTELLCEMGAKRRAGNKGRWRVVIFLEAVKALCRFILMRITRSRPLVTPALPEREPVPEDTEPKMEFEELEADMSTSDSELANEPSLDSLHSTAQKGKPPHEREWTMPRTGMSLPSLPDSGDISSYLLSRVLTADDIKPASKLLNRLQGRDEAAEVLHILIPLIYACALGASSIRAEKGRSQRWWTSAWAPWALGVTLELAARQLRDDRGLRTTQLEREEWSKRGWAMGWWAMRGAFYQGVTKGVVGGVRRRMPGFVAGILEDYEYLWENYYFSTSA